MVLCCIAALVGNAAKVSFDFVNNTYGMTRYSGSTSEYNPEHTIVTDGGVTLTLDGGNNRLWSDGIRMYKYAYVIVSVGDANRITSISCETTGGTSFALTTVAELDELLLKPTTNTFSWNDANNKDLSEVKVKYTATSSNKAIKTLTIEYEPNASVDPSLKDAGLAFAQTEMTLEAGQSVALPAITKATDAAVTVVSDNEGIVTYDEATNTLTGVAAGTTTVTASVPATETYNAGTAKLTVTVTPVMAEFGIASRVEDGRKYLLTFGDKVSTGAVSTGIYESGKYGYGEVADLTVADGVVSAPEDYAFTFTAVDGGYNISNKNGVKFYLSGSFNSFNLNTDPASAAVWNVQRQADGSMKITNVEMDKYIQYVTAYNSYGAYAGAQAGGVMPVLYVLGGETEDPSAVMPVFTVADGDWANEAEGVVFKGASVTLSAPEGTPEGWILAYRLNDGEEEYAEEAVTLTIDANTSVTAYINDEANAVTKTFTVAKIAALTIDPVFGAVAEGTTVEITTATEGALLHGFIGENAIEGVAMPYTFSVTEATEVSVWAENPRYLDSEVLEGAYTIMIPSATPKWEAVTSVDQLRDGDIVTFTAKEYTGKSGTLVTYPAVVMNSVSASGTKVITVAEYDVDLLAAENEFSVEAFTFVIAKDDEGKITFWNADNGFLAEPSANTNAVSFSESAGTAFTVTISESDYAATVTGSSRSLRYNPNITNPVDITTARFAFYTSAQQNIYMYRQLQETPAAPARPTIDGIENDNDKLNLNVGDQLTVRCEEGSTIAYIEESLTPAAIAPRAASATAEWVNTGENPYTYTVQNLGTRLSFAAVKNGVYSEPSVLTISDSGITTGIEGIEAEAAEGAVEFFNLQGVKVNNPVNGLYIRRQGSKVEKVVVR